MERLSGWRDLLLRIGLAGLLALAHTFLWQPIRRSLPAILAPVLDAIPTARAALFDLIPRRPSPAVLIQQGELEIVYSIPGGFYFLVPGIFLVLVAPRRPYWAVLLGVLLALGAVDFGFVALGVGWTDAGFTAHTFVHRFMAQPLSLALPLWLTFGRRLQARQAA